MGRHLRSAIVVVAVCGALGAGGTMFVSSSTATQHREAADVLATLGVSDTGLIPETVREHSADMVQIDHWHRLAALDGRGYGAAPSTDGSSVCLIEESTIAGTDVPSASTACLAANEFARRGLVGFSQQEIAGRLTTQLYGLVPDGYTADIDPQFATPDGFIALENFFYAELSSPPLENATVIAQGEAGTLSIEIPFSVIQHEEEPYPAVTAPAER